MEREIKFRAWDKVGNYFHPGFTLQEIIKIMTTQEPPGIECVAYQFGFRDFFLQQFTGLKDKNGKEIYEGDIVRWYDNGSNYPNVMEMVEPVIVKSLNRMTPFFFDKTEYEVIGNIYENPELLKS